MEEIAESVKIKKSSVEYILYDEGYRKEKRGGKLVKKTSFAFIPTPHYPRELVGRPRKLDDGSLQEIFELYKDGTSCAEIAPLFGVDRTTVYYHLKRAGLWQTHMARKIPRQPGNKANVVRVVHTPPRPIVVSMAPPLKYEHLMFDPIKTEVKTYAQIRKENDERRKVELDKLRARLRKEKEARDKARGGPLMAPLSAFERSRFTVKNGRR
jgi:hypothetical protein